MNHVIRTIVVALLMAICCASLSSAQAQQSIKVPNSLSKLKPVELSTLVLDAMPMAGATRLTWNYMHSASIQWTTSSFKAGEYGEVARDGVARVRVHGRVSTISERMKEELPWGVEMESVGDNAKLSPDRILIGSQNLDGTACLGTPDNNCTFTANEAFTSAMFKARFVCRIDNGNGRYLRYYRLMALGRADMIGVYNYNKGYLGNVTTGIVLSLALKTDPDCSML